MKITPETIKKVINHETGRLSHFAQKQGDPIKDDNVAGYIVGVVQLSNNLLTLFGDLSFADQGAPTCWRCGCLLETKKGLDHQKEPVNICCECGAFIR